MSLKEEFLRELKSKSVENMSVGEQYWWHYMDGESQEEIAAKYKVKKQWISSKLRMHLAEIGLEWAQKDFLKEAKRARFVKRGIESLEENGYTLKDLLTDYRNGDSNQNVMISKYGLSRNALRAILEDEGVELRKQGVRAKTKLTKYENMKTMYQYIAEYIFNSNHDGLSPSHAEIKKELGHNARTITRYLENLHKKELIVFTPRQTRGVRLPLEVKSMAGANALFDEKYPEPLQ